MKCLVFLSTVVILLAPGRSSAHALGAHWQIKGDRIHIEAYFSDDTPAQGALIRVSQLPNSCHAIEMQPIEFRTNAKGECSFERPGPGKYTIIVDAGAGHRKELALEIADRPALIPGVALALGSASQGGFENLSIVAILAIDRQVPVAVNQNDGPSRAEFTRYPWSSVLIVAGSLTALALVVWLLRSGTAG